MGGMSARAAKKRAVADISSAARGDRALGGGGGARGDRAGFFCSGVPLLRRRSQRPTYLEP